MGFNKSVQFRAQPRFSQSVTFKQSASGSGAAIQFVEQLARIEEIRAIKHIQKERV